VEAAFRKTTLAEILAEPTSSRPLCEFPLPVIELKYRETAAKSVRKE
jgi:hypothetical protein